MGERVLVHSSLFILGACVFWWFYLAVLTLNKITEGIKPLSSILALIIMPTVLCVTLGIMIGVTISEEKVKDEEETILTLQGRHTSYGTAIPKSTYSGIWPRAVEEQV